MASEKIAIKYRPHSTDELLGQEATKRILKKQIATGTLPQAMLFWGIRGTGKTTTARMVAEWINCLNPSETGPCGHCINCTNIREGASVDVAEIDAASNNKVEDVMNILDNIKTLPVTLKKKVVILDEVHNLTKVAFDKLLKTLEEPPEHVVFILCTTERHKVPATILSRVVQHEFRVLDSSTISNHLIDVAKKEGVALDEEAAALLAKEGGGSARDSLTLLQPLLCDSIITADMVREMYGLTSIEESLTITKAILEGDAKVLGSYVQDLSLLEIKNVLSELLNCLFNVVYSHIGATPEGGETFKEGISLISSSVDKSRVLYVIKELSKLTEVSNAYLIKAELLMIACKAEEEGSQLATLIKRVEALEKGISVPIKESLETQDAYYENMASTEVSTAGSSEEWSSYSASEEDIPFEVEDKGVEIVKPANPAALCAGTLTLDGLKSTASISKPLVATSTAEVPKVDSSAPLSLDELKGMASNNTVSANGSDDDGASGGATFELSSSDPFADFL